MKNIPVCSLSDLRDGQMKEVTFEGEGKVLLHRLGDDVHATSAFCTHYGAPLAKGVLTADGRVVCPWHGACFNVCTGDIEDAPAPAAIHSFKTRVKDGKVYVTADPSQTLKSNMTRTPTLLTADIPSTGKGLVIVGGGGGTFHAIDSLREHGYTGNITVLSKEMHAPIDRPKLSKALITDPSKLEWRTAADLKIKYGTTLRFGVTVTSIDTSSKQVVVDGGKESVAYDKLILAMGGTPRRLPIDGADLDNVYTFRGIEDSKKVDAAAQEGKRMVVIGSSFISMELVVAVAKRKLASIDVIGIEEFPFEPVLGKEVGKGLKKYHESQGVKFHMQSKVEKIVASESDPSQATGVVVDGQTIPVDFVVMGVGVAPATEFLKQSGFQLEKDGGVKVDEYLQVMGQTDVYAIGDIAWHPQQRTGESRRIEHWNVAGNHGRAVGKTIAGQPQPFVKVPIFWSAQGQQLRYCGLSVGYDEVIINGDPGEMKFIAYYVKEGQVVAVASMQNDPVVSKASELFRLGLMPSADEVRAGKNLLDIDITSSASRAQFMYA
ncbi:FAD/NAD(P)-binding domain-containing protein [Paxillus ammoniavirescens]|nr:FAD/NAD(P)-binding domain-containing protein [Paxillus ammoniavirescens]